MSLLRSEPLFGERGAINILSLRDKEPENSDDISQKTMITKSRAQNTKDKSLERSLSTGIRKVLLDLFRHPLLKLDSVR